MALLGAMTFQKLLISLLDSAQNTHNSFLKEGACVVDSQNTHLKEMAGEATLVFVLVNLTKQPKVKVVRFIETVNLHSR